jgi:hypothetical protein
LFSAGLFALVAVLVEKEARNSHSNHQMGNRRNLKPLWANAAVLSMIWWCSVLPKISASILCDCRCEKG